MNGDERCVGADPTALRNPRDLPEAFYRPLRTPGYPEGALRGQLSPTGQYRWPDGLTGARSPEHRCAAGRSPSGGTDALRGAAAQPAVVEAEPRQTTISPLQRLRRWPSRSPS